MVGRLANGLVDWFVFKSDTSTTVLCVGQGKNHILSDFKVSQLTNDRNNQRNTIQYKEIRDPFGRATTAIAGFAESTRPVRCFFGGSIC
jgi:hypothetical protein